jgi:predicted ArsR family transcriptional regulator
MTTMQEQARALGDPTRHAIFRYIADAERPVAVAELTDHLGLNHNAIRQHLAKLVSSGMVLEEKAPSIGRGRPRLLYTIDPAAEGRWGVQGPYERLSLWLSEMIRTGDTAVTVGRRVGRRRALGSGASSDPAGELVEQMARNGFDPKLRRTGDKIDITLQNCPFATTALADPDTVCAIHLGIAQGIAETAGSGLAIDQLIPKDPRRANCRLLAHVAPPEAN